MSEPGIASSGERVILVSGCCRIHCSFFAPCWLSREEATHADDAVHMGGRYRRADRPEAVNDDDYDCLRAQMCRDVVRDEMAIGGRVW